MDFILDSVVMGSEYGEVFLPTFLINFVAKIIFFVGLSHMGGHITSYIFLIYVFLVVKS